MTFNLSIANQELSFDKNLMPVVENTKGYVKCVFDFQTDDWNGTIKTAYFRNTTTGIITSQILTDNQCIIPPEALSDEGNIQFSVAGEKEDYRITSSVVQFFNRATVYGGNSSDPTPSQYEQIMAAAAAAQNAAESAEQTAADIKQQADSGAFNGEQGPQGEQGTQGPKGDTGPQGPAGEDGKAATVTVGSVTTAQSGTSATVSNSGTPNAAVLDFVIPQGEKGDSAFTSIKPGTQEEPYIIQKYGYYCTTGVGWVQVGTQGQDISTISELEFYRPFYCGTNTLIVFGLSNKNVNVESAFVYIITVGDDIKASVYPATSGSSKEPFNYSLEEIILSLMAYVNIFQPVFDEGANAVDKVIKVGSYDNSNGIFQLAPTDEYRKKSAVITQDSSNVTLNDNTEYRMQVAATINLTLPSSIADDYECSLVFESGDTATVLSYAADSIKFVGDDCDAEGDFIPQANTAYEVNIKNLGYNRIIARVGAF